MKKVICVLILLTLIMVGCGSGGSNQERHSFRIAAYGDELKSLNTATKASIREHFYFAYPDDIGSVFLFILVDEKNEMIRDSNIVWTVEDPSLGYSEPIDNQTLYIQRFKPSAVGSCRVTATYQGETATTNVTVFHCVRTQGGRGFILSSGTFTDDENLADFWIPTNYSYIDFKAGYWFDVNSSCDCDRIAAMTGSEGTISGPSIQTYIDGPCPYLIKARDGSIYAAAMSVSKICYRKIN